MFRINFYPEYVQRRIDARRRTTQLVGLYGVIGVEAFVLVGLLLTGALLTKRANDIASSITRMSSVITPTETAAPAIEVARELVQLRETRIDWAPKLTAISKEIQPILLVNNIDGRAAAKKIPARLRIEGEVRDGNEPLENVSQFLEGLRRDASVSKDFSAIELGSLKGRASTEFELVCRTADRSGS